MRFFAAWGAGAPEAGGCQQPSCSLASFTRLVRVRAGCSDQAMSKIDPTSHNSFAGKGAQNLQGQSCCKSCRTRSRLCPSCGAARKEVGIQNEVGL